MRSQAALSAVAVVGIVVFGAAVILAPQPVSAKEERDPAQIAPGMTYSEVAALWGAPREKLEHESRRKDVWIYPQTEVRFEEGKVVSAGYRGAAGAQNQAARKEQTLEEEWEAALDDGNSQGVAVEDILNEIVDSGGAAEEKTNQPNRPVPLEAAPGIGVLERR